MGSIRLVGGLFLCVQVLVGNLSAAQPIARTCAFLPDLVDVPGEIMRDGWDSAQVDNAAAGLLKFAPPQVSVIGRRPGADDVRNPTLHVRVHDESGVPAATLEQAQAEAAAIFYRARVSLVWVDVETCAGRCLVLKIIPRSVGTKSRNQLVVGITPGTRTARGTLAFAFYDRISKLSAELHLETGRMLGHVMAHELGHLLLPYEAHAVIGVMRPVWDRVQANGVINGTLTFAPDQAEQIRKRLSASASPIPHAP
jgi:hypothetical protein